MNPQSLYREYIIFSKFVDLQGLNIRSDAKTCIAMKLWLGLCLLCAVQLVSGAYPGKRCDSGRDCDGENTGMTCYGENGPAPRHVLASASWPPTDIESPSPSMIRISSAALSRKGRLVKSRELTVSTFPVNPEITVT